MAVGFGVATCANHPDREALGICVRCRTRVCAECSTKVDGINYCVTCLETLALSKDGGSAASGDTPAVLAWLAAAGFVVVLSLSAWGLVERAPMSIEVAFRVTGPIDALDRGFLLTRRAGIGAALRAVAAGLPLASVLVAIWYLERVEGVRGLRPFFGVAIALAWIARAVLLAPSARADARLLFPGLPMPKTPGRAVDVARTAGVTGLGLAFWGLLLALGLNAGAIGVVSVAPLLCVRGLVAPGWLARAACTNEGGVRAFVGAAKDMATRRANGIVVELLLIVGTLLLAANLYGLTMIGVMLARVFLAIDVTSVDAFLSIKNVLVQMAVIAAAMLVLEPLRAALSAVWLVDARVRAEGLDLRAAVERALEVGQRKKLPQDGVTATAAVLAFAVLALGAVAHAQDIGFSPVRHDAGVAQQVEPPDHVQEPVATGVPGNGYDPQDDGVREKVTEILERPEFREFDDGSGAQSKPSDFLSRLLEWLIRWLRFHPRDTGVRGPTIPLPPAPVFIAIAILFAVVLIAWLVAQYVRERRSRTHDPNAPAASLDVREKPPDVLLEEASALAARGELRLALRSLYLATLVALDRRRLIDFDPHRTNWHYLRKMPRGDAKELFTEFTRLFDHKWYGDEAVTAAEYESARTLAVRIVEVTRDIGENAAA